MYFWLIIPERRTIRRIRLGPKRYNLVWSERAQRSINCQRVITQQVVVVFGLRRLSSKELDNGDERGDIQSTYVLIYIYAYIFYVFCWNTENYSFWTNNNVQNKFHLWLIIVLLLCITSNVRQWFAFFSFFLHIKCTRSQPRAEKE